MQLHRRYRASIGSSPSIPEQFIAVASRHGLDPHARPAALLATWSVMDGTTLSTIVDDLNKAVTGRNDTDEPSNSYLLGGTRKHPTFLMGCPNIASRPFLFDAMANTLRQRAQQTETSKPEQLLADIGRLAGRGIIAIHAHRDGQGRSARGLEAVVNGDVKAIDTVLRQGKRRGFDHHVTYDPPMVKAFIDSYAERWIEPAHIIHVTSQLDAQYATRKPIVDNAGHHAGYTRDRQALYADLEHMPNDARDHMSRILQNLYTSDAAVAAVAGADFVDLARLTHAEALSIIATDTLIKEAYALGVVTDDIERGLEHTRETVESVY